MRRGRRRRGKRRRRLRRRGRSVEGRRLLGGETRKSEKVTGGVLNTIGRHYPCI